MAGEKQLKTVIRGLPSDFDVDEIIQELGTHNITPEHVSVMRNRKQNKNMPLFLVVSRKCPANQAIFQVTSIGWNANSVKYKLGELRNFLCDEDPDIIGIQETHLGPADSFKLPNYICHRSDRLSHRGGGTAIFVRNSLRHHVVSFNTSTFENTTVRIELGNNTHLTLSCIYKPPRNHINTSELDAILNASPKVMLLVILMLTTHVGTQGAQTLMETLFTTGRAPMPWKSWHPLLPHTMQPVAHALFLILLLLKI
ncbi:uncharacterized protein TNCV_1938091 [Trichonephila clavipes]|nr:uncharacterized protein TNCV_1938091 [Trichonephila clavipes]